MIVLTKKERDEIDKYVIYDKDGNMKSLKPNASKIAKDAFKILKDDDKPIIEEKN